jgi:ABC-type multidrug transport system fused ATPase/permease subunit
MIGNIRKILFVLTRPEKRKLGRLVLMDIFVSVIDIAFLALLLFVINFYAQNGGGLHRLILPQWLADPHSPALISLFLLLFLVKSLAGYLALRARYRFVYQVASRMAEDNLLKYLEGDFTDYVNIDSAIQGRMISQQPIEFCHYILAGWMQAITEGVLIVLAIAGILWFDARLFLLLLAILLPAIFLLAYITRRRLRSVRTHVKTSSERAMQYLQEALTGYVESNIYAKNNFFIRRYAGYQQELNHYLAELQITQGIPSRLIEVFAVLGLFMLINFHATALVTLGAFMAAAYKIIPGIVKLSNISGQMKTYAFALDDLAAHASVGARAAGGGRTAAFGRASNTREPFEGETGIAAFAGEKDIAAGIRSIRFDRVSFSHNRKEVLKDLSLSIGSGDFLGISGLSGKGKTTVINLLLGFLTPDHGDILVNGKIADERARQRQWERIAYVKQQPFLLHDTLLHNITLGDDRYDEGKMLGVLRGSGLAGSGLLWAGSYPECLGKMVTEQGKNISGGQRQRIAIARALYKDADLVLLDEPFNELDRASELHLLHYCQELARSGKMVVLITHHKESFSFCNKVIALDAQSNILADEQER